MTTAEAIWCIAFENHWAHQQHQQGMEDATVSSQTSMNWSTNARMALAEHERLPAVRLPRRSCSGLLARDPATAKSTYGPISHHTVARGVAYASRCARFSCSGRGISLLDVEVRKATLDFVAGIRAAAQRW